MNRLVPLLVLSATLLPAQAAKPVTLTPDFSKAALRALLAIREEEGDGGRDASHPVVSRSLAALLDDANVEATTPAETEMMGRLEAFTFARLEHNAQRRAVRSWTEADLIKQGYGQMWIDEHIDQALSNSSVLQAAAEKEKSCYLQLAASLRGRELLPSAACNDQKVELTEENRVAHPEL